MTPACPACSATAHLASVYDDPDEGHAHNVYACPDCGAVGVQRVWARAGWTWLMADGSVSTEAPRTTPPEPIDAADAAAALVDMGLAESYEQARADVEAARADVAADLVGDGVMRGPV